MRNHDEELLNQAIALADVVKNILKERAGISFPKFPSFAKRPIVDFMNRMRVNGMEKFNAPAYLSVINFYANVKNMGKHRSLGTLIVYVRQDFLPKLITQMQYPGIHKFDEGELKDACGALCNVIAGQFKTEVVRLGYIELEMSHFSSYRNDVFEGVEYAQGEKIKFQIDFEIDDQINLVVELSMGKIPRKF